MPLYEQDSFAKFYLHILPKPQIFYCYFLRGALLYALIYGICRYITVLYFDFVICQ